MSQSFTVDLLCLRSFPIQVINLYYAPFVCISVFHSSSNHSVDGITSFHHPTNNTPFRDNLHTWRCVLLRTQGSTVKLFGWTVLENAASSTTGGQVIGPFPNRHVFYWLCTNVLQFLTVQCALESMLPLRSPTVAGRSSRLLLYNMRYFELFSQNAPLGAGKMNVAC